MCSTTDSPVDAPIDRTITDTATAAIVDLLVTGGDDRIRPGADGRNRYLATATPFAGLSYGSSTISSIGADALAHLASEWYPRITTPLTSAAYAAELDAMRSRIAAHYADEGVAIVIAASGTDLEYVGLAAAPAGSGPLCGILLGRDEVGSGCIHSAAGRFFAERTAIGTLAATGEPIDDRHAANRLADVAIRMPDGQPRTSADIRADLENLADSAIAAGEHPVIHVVHGSKTGLTLPSMTDCQLIADRYGTRVTMVIDACQLRIDPAAVRNYLRMGAVVLATGSKFAGGAPFSGFALVPDAVMRRAAPLSPGFAKLARRAEWPAAWPGRDILADEANAGLMLRLAGTMFEIDRFLALPADRVAEIVSDFEAAVDVAAHANAMAVVPTQARRETNTRGLARSLATLDLSEHHPHLDFDAATAIHRQLCLASGHAGGPPLRIGQPVRARQLPSGTFAATLRLSLTMAMVGDHARLTRTESQHRLATELDYICRAIAHQANRIGSLSPA